MNEIRISGPFVSAAFLCEKILVERDNTPSYIRAIDRFTITTFEQLPPGVQTPPPATIQVTIAISLKAGDVGAGSHKLRIVQRKPDGSTGMDVTVPVFLSGSDDNGAILGLPIAIPNPEEGLHWFDVYFEETMLLTRIAMRILFQPVMPYQAAPLGSQ